jgi:hypothetical protein
MLQIVKSAQKKVNADYNETTGNITSDDLEAMVNSLVAATNKAISDFTDQIAILNNNISVLQQGISQLSNQLGVAPLIIAAENQIVSNFLAINQGSQAVVSTLQTNISSTNQVLAGISQNSSATQLQIVAAQAANAPYIATQANLDYIINNQWANLFAQFAGYYNTAMLPNFFYTKFSSMTANDVKVLVDQSIVVVGCDMKTSGGTMEQASAKKFDSGGHMLWEKNLTIAQSHCWDSVTEWPNVGLLTSGYLFPTFRSYHAKGLLNKYDLNGNIIWQYTYQLTEDGIHYAIATYDGNVVYGGTEVQTASQTYSQDITKIYNSNQTIMWDLQVNLDAYYSDDTAYFDSMYLTEDSQHNIIEAGMAYECVDTTKITPNGVIIWEQIWETGYCAWEMQMSPDGNYTIATACENWYFCYSSYLLQYNPNGVLLFAITFHYQYLYLNFNCLGVLPNGYLIGGVSFASKEDGNLIQISELFKVDYSGNTLWEVRNSAGYYLGIARTQDNATILLEDHGGFATISKLYLN